MAAGNFNREVEIIIGTNADDGMNFMLFALADPTLFEYYKATFNITAPMQLFDIPFESGTYFSELSIYERSKLANLPP